ncbi:MAG: F0F1 ATP synthase subunit A [Actinobacteria bacterium]|nr:F0F1 ATP synthase subunit A [Actinomycetota bacterium]
MSAVLALLGSSRPPEGFEKPTAEIFDTACLIGSGDFCFNRIALYMFVAAAIVVALFVLAFARPRLVPRGIQNLMESGVEFVRNQIAVEVIGHDGIRFVPLLLSLFFFIFAANILGIVPFFQLPATSRMAIPAFLAVVVWLVFNAVGIQHHGLRYFKNVLFPPGVPKALYILLTPIELVSVFLVRPLTLSVRLLGNMFAGHMLLTIFFLGTAYLLAQWKTVAFGVAAFGLGVGLVGFEILVAVLQAYIFTILTAVYIGGALHPEH